MKSRTVLTMVGIVIVFGLGFFVGQNGVICKICAPEAVDMSLLWETWAQLKENYVNPDGLDTEKMVQGAAAGMVSSLGDPYTIFFNPKETKSFLEDVGGEFEGVGMEIGVRDGQLQVVSPIEGTPADRAGLRPGDKIIRVDDATTIDITAEEAVTLIRGPKGSEVTLTILRKEWTDSREIKIKRDIIQVPALKWELINDDVAYIKLYHFSEKSDRNFRDAALEIINSSAKRIILDLRSNPGGYLERAQDIAGWFLEVNQLVTTEDFGNSEENKEYKARGNSRLIDYPLVVLINKGSASASEILAAALRDNRNIQLIGETSYGKGSVQTLRQLSDGSSLKVTVARWLTPKGDHISEKGLKPDVEVELTEEDWLAEKDPQLDRAIEIIKKID